MSISVTLDTKKITQNNTNNNLQIVDSKPKITISENKVTQGPAGFPWLTIVTDMSINIDNNRQNLVFGAINVDGEISIEGELVII